MYNLISNICRNTQHSLHTQTHNTSTTDKCECRVKFVEYIQSMNGTKLASSYPESVTVQW